MFAVRLPGLYRKNAIVGLSFSIALHLALVVALMLHQNAALKGNRGSAGGLVGAGDGLNTFQVAVIPGPVEAFRTEMISEDVQNTEVRSEPEAPMADPQISEPVDNIRTSSERRPDQNKSEPVTQLSSSNGELSKFGASPGQLDGAQTLLEQIARCLPKGVRPDLSPAVLTIALDETGRLRAVPTLNVDTSRLSREQLRSSNLIIQAGLQCGPYNLGAEGDTVLELPADFSSLEPGVSN